MFKLNQSGIINPVVIIVLLLIIAGAGILAFKNFPLNESQPTVDKQFQGSSSAILKKPSPTPLVSPSPKASPLPTPSPKPSPTPSQAPISPTHAEPPSVSITKKKSELGSNIAEVKFVYPGTHKVNIEPQGGTVGIYGLFKANDSTFMEVVDSATIQIGFAEAFGRTITVGENKENLLIKKGDTLLDALNGNDLVLTIPITVNVTD